jgi:arabinan endo-1,5-alpha-L-arabinosidase
MKRLLLIFLLSLSSLTMAQEATEEIPEGMFTNPVFDQDFPDPDVLQVEVGYYAYATNSGSFNIQAAYSTDLVNWEYLGEVMPSLPDWAVLDFGYVWAPDVSTTDNGESYLMYFTARFAIEDGGSQCIGVATSDNPEGPFLPVGDEPIVCQINLGGSIDPASFVDNDGTRYLLWKNDGNCCGGQAWIYIQETSEDGLSLVGEEIRLFRADEGWEGILVEGPTLWKHEEQYFLFYSANDYLSPNYAVGYAVADDVLGPYTKAEDLPFLKTSIPGGIVGPGGQDIVLDADGQSWMLFHGWRPGSYRSMNLIKVDWLDGLPVVAEFSREPQEAPATEE